MRLPEAPKTTPIHHPQFAAQVTPAGERPYSAEVLYGICENLAPFVLETVKRLEKYQWQLDNSEGSDQTAAEEVIECKNNIWQAIEYATKQRRGAERSYAEADVYLGLPSSQAVNPYATEA